jgi:hypothetical protein
MSSVDKTGKQFTMGFPVLLRSSSGMLPREHSWGFALSCVEPAYYILGHSRHLLNSLVGSVY